MTYKIPTFEQALNLVVDNPDIFNHKIEEIDTHKFHIFSYRLANYEDFENNKDQGAYEMRGITYLEKDGAHSDEIVCYPHLHKFFNIDQGGIQNSLKHLLSEEISLVQTKEDGSMMVPIVVDKKIYWKTQRTFTNEQTEAAEILTNAGIRSFIIECFQAGHIPIFEYVSPFNQIVLNYKLSELRLLQVRDINTGEYIDLDYVHARAEYYNIAYASAIEYIAEQVPGSGLQGFVDHLETVEGIEGYILTFKSSHKVKAKTAEYFRLHRLLTENLNAENCLVEWVLDGVIDDMLCQVPEKDPRRLRALDISNHVRHQISKIETVICTVIDKHNRLSRKDFAIRFQNHAFFSILMRCYLLFQDNDFEYSPIIIEYLRKKTHKLESAREWLKDTGYVEKMV